MDSITKNVILYLIICPFIFLSSQVVSYLIYSNIFTLDKDVSFNLVILTSILITLIFRSIISKKLKVTTASESNPQPQDSDSSINTITFINSI